MRAIRIAEVRLFLEESNRIEGILREPNKLELEATLDLLYSDPLTVHKVSALALAYAPRAVIRMTAGMNVRVGSHVPPAGGPNIPRQLELLLDAISRNQLTPHEAHCQYETLHPFMDGNGRTGRAVWAWHMMLNGRDPFSLPFLHRWYYDSLDNSRSR